MSAALTWRTTQDIVKTKKAAVLEAARDEGKTHVERKSVQGNNLIAKIGQFRLHARKLPFLLAASI